MTKCIDGTANNDEILFEMDTPLLPKHTDTSLQLWSLCGRGKTAFHMRGHGRSAPGVDLMKKMLHFRCHDFNFTLLLAFH